MANTGTPFAKDVYQQDATRSYATFQNEPMPMQPVMNQGFQTLTTEPVKPSESQDDALGGLGSFMKMSAWDQHSSAAYLFTDTMSTVAQQVIVLFLIIMEVFRSKKHLAPCTPNSMADVFGWDPEWQGSFAAACGCEFSKGCVRIFPIMALMISLVVAKRVVLSKRGFYLLLKKGNGLLKFQPPKVKNDRLFWILVFMLFMATCHFSLNIAYKYHELRQLAGADIIIKPGHTESEGGEVPKKGKKNQLAKVLEHLGVHEGLREYLWDLLMDYLLPATIFMAFLISSYDLSASIQPMTKYFDTNPEEQKRRITTAKMVDEAKCAAIVHERLDAMEEMTQCADIDDQSDKLWTEVAHRAEALEDADTPVLDNGDMFAKMWPAKLLLDPRTRDGDSSMFFQMWFYFSLGCDCLMVVCILFFVKQMKKDLFDVFVEREYDDAAGFTVQALCFKTILGFLWESIRVTRWQAWPNAGEIREQMQNAKPIAEQRPQLKESSNEAGDV